MAAKENYTAEQEKIILSVYDPNASQDERKSAVAKLATQFGKKPSSIIGKLVSMGIYKSLSYQKKGGDDTKEGLVTKIEEQLGIPPNLFESLAKANKIVVSRLHMEISYLCGLRDAVRESQESDAAFAAETAEQAAEPADEPVNEQDETAETIEPAEQDEQSEPSEPSEPAEQAEQAE